MMKGIIIDDEPLIRMDLKHMLTDHPDMDIIGEAGTLPHAERLLMETRPDAVFLDIQLIGGTGFDLLPFISPGAGIIIVTAYDEFAVRGFEVNALDYLLKPIKPQRLAEALNRLRNHCRGDRTASLSAAGGNQDYRLLVKTEGDQCVVSAKAVDAIVSMGGNYTRVYLHNGESHAMRRTLSQWESLLPEGLFFRVHRSTILNLDRIRRISRPRNGPCHIYLAGEDNPFEVSRRSMVTLKRYLKDRLQECTD